LVHQPAKANGCGLLGASELILVIGNPIHLSGGDHACAQGAKKHFSNVHGGQGETSAKYRSVGLKTVQQTAHLPRQSSYGAQNFL
jgi:hypothetical protein